MFRKLSARSSPRHKQPPLASPHSSTRPKSQTLTICSAALPHVAASKSTPPDAPIFQNTQQASGGYHHHLQAELLPPETVIAILDAFAKALLGEKERFEELKLTCLEGAKLGHNDAHPSDTSSSSILKSSHTVLTYLSWGIRHIEKASAERESKEEHLKKAEQMLRSLIDTMQAELDDHPTTVLASVRVPNASFILGLAHVFLALARKMRKNTSKLAASHLLEAFVVCPRDARKRFIPELWSQLFHPHLAAVEAWYKKEHTNIIRSFPISSSISGTSSHCPPSSMNNNVNPTLANTAVTRATSLMDLVVGLRSSRRGISSTNNESNNVQNEHDQKKLLEKMNMQVKLLSNLYEQSLDEGTIQYARHYQDLITRYYGRFSFDQASKMQRALQCNDDHSKMRVVQCSDDHSQMQRALQCNDDHSKMRVVQCSDDHSQMQPVIANKSSSHNNREDVETNIRGVAAPEVKALVKYDDSDSKVITGAGWMGGNALQLRRSLYNAIFATVPMERTSKKNRYTNLSASSQVASLLRLCNKDVPEVLDPLRPKVDMDENACTHIVAGEATAGHQPADHKPATIRDMVIGALLPEEKEEPALGSFTSVLDHSSRAQIINHDSLNMSDQESSTSSVVTHVALTGSYQNDDEQQIMSKEASAIKSNGHSKRLIDLLKDPSHRLSEVMGSSTLNHEANKAGHPLSRNGRQIRMSLRTDGTKMEEQRMIKRRNSESSAPLKGHNSGRYASEDQGLKRMAISRVSSSRRSGSGGSEVPQGKCGASRPNMVQRKKIEATDVQVRNQTRSSNANNAKGRFKGSGNKGNAPSQAVSPPEGKVQQGGVNAKGICYQLEELANELCVAVQAARLCGNTPEGVERCEEVLLKLSQAWLECKSASLLQQKEGAHKDADSARSSGVSVLEELTEELLFILATSELQEAQRLALCLLSASIGSRKSRSNHTPMLQEYNQSAEKGGKCEKAASGGQLPSNPNAWQALSHLLQQQGRLPEAALLLHLLNPAQYSASCHHFLPHLLPLLLDLAQHNNVPPTTNTAFHHIADSYNSAFHSRLRLFGDSLKPRALALMMMSRLLAVVDGVTRLQACKHVLFPNVNALPCLLHSLDCAPSLDERAAAAFILTTCMQADKICRQHVVTHVKLSTVVALMQQSASNTSAFQTSINFVTELLRTRKAYITEMLGCIRQDGILNCMHALMAYLQTASIENQPPAAGLLLQLDLLLGDEQRYSVFREEALEALLAPLVSESSKEASFIAARVLSTIGRSHSEQELEAWLLKKAGLGAATPRHEMLADKSNMSTTAIPMAIASKDEEEVEVDERALVEEWDERVARALIRQGSGRLVSRALANGLQSSMAEVRKMCLRVAAWLTSHLSNMHQLDQAQHKVCKLMSGTAKERMREALQAHLQEIASTNSGSAIVERVFAALTLQNLAT